MNQRGRILVVDDEEWMRDACRQILVPEGYGVEEAMTGDQALDLLARAAYDLVILDLRIPHPDGLEVLRRVHDLYPGLAVVVVTGYATVETAVAAMRLGAVDFLPKPLTPEVLRLTIARALREVQLARENQLLRAQLAERQGSNLGLIGETEPMRRIHDLVLRVGPTDSTVLITGESGTGKELVARAIHAHSQRRDRPLVTVDCGALVGALFESELFGHVKGSFTGATTLKHGRFELADGGTIFLDEIANVSPEIQAKLLRVIQEREFTRVGSAQVIPADVRILAATSRDLPTEIRAGRFREDLFYRLCVIPIGLPALRQRREDIPLLARHFLEEHNARPGTIPRGLSGEALRVLVQHDWPGNVRELKNAVERACILARDELITPADLLPYSPLAKPGAGADGLRSLAQVEHDHITRVLSHHGGNRTLAAKTLGIDRKTLYRKLQGRS